MSTTVIFYTIAYISLSDVYMYMYIYVYLIVCVPVCALWQ